MNEFGKFFAQPISAIIEQIKSGEGEILEISYTYFTTPKFRAGQTGFSRRDINVWRKEDLLPYSLEAGKWNQFSIAECIWLRFVGVLKKFGVKHEDIRRIKKSMFPTDIVEIRENLLDLMDLPYLPKEFAEIYSELLTELDNTPEDEMLSGLRETNYNKWNHIIMVCCKLHLNFALIIDENANFLFINLGNPKTETHSTILNDIMKSMSRYSFLLVNISELCKDFFENEKVLIDSEYYWGLMNAFEQKVIAEVHTGKYKMITVKIEDGSITHIKLTKKDKENEETLRKLSRLFKTNDFKDIELTLRNGKIVKYSETDISKMETK